MKCPHNARIAIVDGDRFVLMKNSGQIFEPKLEKVAVPDIEGTNFSAGVRNQDPSGQERDGNGLGELAYAAAVAEYLNAMAIADDFKDLILIADPKTMGEMRRHYHIELKERLVGEIGKTLTREPVDAIERAIADA